MLKKLVNIMLLMSTGALLVEPGFATEHHGGHGRGGAGGGGAGCPKVGIRNMKPAALSEVAAGSEFSVIVLGAREPDDIEVTAKAILIPIQTDIKDDFIVVKAKLPPELQATAARINVKVKSKIASCTEEAGWLLKITH